MPTLKNLHLCSLQPLDNTSKEWNRMEKGKILELEKHQSNTFLHSVKKWRHTAWLTAEQKLYLWLLRGQITGLRLTGVCSHLAIIWSQETETHTPRHWTYNILGDSDYPCNLFWKDVFKMPAGSSVMDWTKLYLNKGVFTDTFSTYHLLANMKTVSVMAHLWITQSCWGFQFHFSNDLLLVSESKVSWKGFWAQT